MARSRTPDAGPLPADSQKKILKQIEGIAVIEADLETASQAGMSVSHLQARLNLVRQNLQDIYAVYFGTGDQDLARTGRRRSG